MHPLDPVREKLLTDFRSCVSRAQREFDQFTSELLLELSSLTFSDYCYRLYRVDVIGRKDGKSVVREVACDATAVEASALPDSVRIESPLVWYGVEFRVGKEPDAEALLQWSSRWIDIEDARYDKSAEFHGVIHSVRPPKRREGGFEIAIDFGTAPTNAFDELIEILERENQIVAVGSYFLFDEAE